MAPSPRLSGIKAALLDMGGVILDMGNAAGLPVGSHDWRGREALLREVRERGGRAGMEDLERLVFAPWSEEYARRYERGREARWEPHLRRLRRATGVRARNLTLLRSWFRPYGERLRPVAGAAAALAALAALGLRMAVVSNVPLPGRLYLEVLEGFGLARPFSLFQFSYDAGSRKPSPAMLRAALAELGVADPREAMMVGDRRGTDVAAGLAAGTWTVWLRGGEADGPAPDAEIGSLGELPALLA